VETDDGTATVTLTADTKVQHPIGLGARKREVDQEVLIPGLKLKYEGTGDQNQVTAEKITFDQDDLSIAKVIQGGLNRKKFDLLTSAHCVRRTCSHKFTLFSENAFGLSGPICAMLLPAPHICATFSLGNLRYCLVFRPTFVLIASRVLPEEPFFYPHETCATLEPAQQAKQIPQHAH